MWCARVSAIGAPLWRGPGRALASVLVHGVVAAGRQRLALSAAQVDEGFVKRNSAAVRRRVK